MIKRTWVLAIAISLVGLLVTVGLALLSFFPGKTEPQASTSPGTPLRSFFANRAEYATAFAPFSELPRQSTQAIVTSHHYLARQVIAETVAGVDPTGIKTVLLLSPDHFQAVTDPQLLAVTTTARWQSPWGVVPQDFAQLEALTTLDRVMVAPGPFLTEHGVYTLMPFLHFQLPNAHFVPLILRQHADLPAAVKLGRELRQQFDPATTVVVVSSDFSHQLTATAAAAADAQSLTVLQNQQPDQVTKVTSDCRICLAVLFGYLEGIFTQFELVRQTDSWQLSSQSPDSVTSYLSGRYLRRQSATPPTPAETPTGSESPAGPNSSAPIKLLFGGDLMYDRHIRQQAERYGYRHPLAPLEPLFAEHDWVVTNLEGPISTFPSKSVGSVPGTPANFIFTFAPAVAPTLASQGLRVVNLGNNHILNFGPEGVTQTKAALEQAGMRFFGHTGQETESAQRVTILERDGYRIGLVNYNQFLAEGWALALADLAALRPQVQLLVVYTHWGNEYVPTANQVITTQGRQLVEAGADLVIGSHPHVIQNWEEYQGKRIYYSLGNLVFDQYFRPEVQQGLLVGVTVSPGSGQLDFREYRVRLKPNGQTEPDSQTPSPASATAN